MSQFKIDIKKAVAIANKRTTTVDDVCKLIFEPIREYQDTREDFYIQELKDSHESGTLDLDSSDNLAENISKKIENDLKKFVPGYANKSIDSVLDAMNRKEFKTKKSSESLLMLLVALKETYEKDS